MNEWKLISCVLCDKYVSPSLKGEFYKVMIKPNMFVWDRILTGQELVHAKDESSENVDVEIDVWV